MSSSSSKSAPRSSTPREVLSAEKVSWRTPEGRLVLDDLSFHLGAEKTSLVGANGAGKTTLARLLVGELEPSRGVIRRSGVLAWLPQSVVARSGRVAELLGISNVVEAIAAIEQGATAERHFDTVGDRWDVEARARVWLDRLGLPELPMDAAGERLSGGEAVRVALAGCLLREPDLLVLDEPTNHLDSAARSKLYAALDEHGGGLLVISHDRALLRRMERTLELGDRGLRSYDGGFDHYRAQLRIEEEAARRRADSAAKELDRQRRAAQEAVERQARRARSGKRAAARKGLSKLETQAAKRQAERTSGRLADVHGERIAKALVRLDEARSLIRDETPVRDLLGATNVPAGRTVVEATGVNVCFDRRWLFPRDLDVRLVGPARLALAGPSGSGKSTLARVLVGELEPQRGRVRRVERRVAWLDQQARVLPDGLTLLDAMRAGNASLTAREAYWGLDRYGLGRDFAARFPETLSGGERMRAALACLFGSSRPPRFLVLDEPTNNLDLQTVEVLEKALAAYGGALVVISHDEDFLAAAGVEERLELS
ncbi:MAG: ATP-binding cassette domain-containing protein [Acidobacteriota bacterium]